jgi:glycosyltransferase involved in cell wall biosynthesis
MSNSNDPLVSICIPTYNGEEYIESALLSALCQSYPNLEIIISDDNSKDNTLSIIESTLKNSKIPFYIHKHIPQGIGENWNNCVRKSNGKYIKFLFQDDLLKNDCIEKMMGLMRNYPKVGMVYCKRNFIYDSDNFEHLNWIKNCGVLHKNWFNLLIKEEVLEGKMYLKDSNLLKVPFNKIGEPTAVLLNKECFEKVGFFDKELKQTLDFEYWYRLMKFFEVGFLDDELVTFRLHINQTTFVNQRSLLNEDSLFKQKIYENIFWQLDRKIQFKLFKSQSKIGDFYRFLKSIFK